VPVIASVSVILRVMLIKAETDVLSSEN